MDKIIINGIEIGIGDNETILEVAKRNGFTIPTLCHLKLHDMNYENRPVACRICMVEVEENSNKRLVPSCDTIAKNNMVITTNSSRVINARRTVMELILSNHPKDCLYCERNTNCDLQTLAYDLNIKTNRFEGKHSSYGIDNSSKSIVKNLDKCILCRRCESICANVQTVDVYSAVNRGFDTIIAPAFNESLHNTTCTFCGQCVSVCPTGALTESSQMDELLKTLSDDSKVVVVQTAPAVRVAIGEEFKAEPGSITTNKMVSALKLLGFDYVFDTNWGADLTILEEATEILNRLNGNERLPILTSCCPSWIKFIEHQFPSLIDIPSSCKSPHEMFGAVTKTYFAQKMNIDPKNITVVSVMPCVAKKYEAARPELSIEEQSDVDIVITTRELSKMIKEAGINYLELEDKEFDNPLGESSGAAQIFGATGGVLEAALRTVASWLGEDSNINLNFEEVRGLKGIKEANITIAGREIKVAAAHGLGEARKLLEKVERNENQYDIIEIMACPGGCIAGGGQPYHHGNRDIIKKRLNAIYQIDENKEIRLSHENPDIIKLYDEFLIKPGSEIAHKLLHTHYIKREGFE